MFLLGVANACARVYRRYYRSSVKLLRKTNGANIYVAVDPRLQARLRRSNTLAVALGENILFRSKRVMTRSLLAHEMKHVEQARTVPLFPLIYAWETLTKGYWRNKFEVAARRCE
jgi:hypothetical protein